MVVVVNSTTVVGDVVSSWLVSSSERGKRDCVYFKRVQFTPPPEVLSWGRVGGVEWGGMELGLVVCVCGCVCGC